MTDQAPKTVHIWMPDRRSLCDRRPRSRAYEWPNDAALDAQIQAPVCGACIVIAGQIRTEAAKLVATVSSGHRGIWPSTPADAYRLLGDTRWQASFDPEPPEGLAEPDYYRRSITDFYTEKFLTAAGEDAAKRDVAWRAAMIERRDALEPPNDDDDDEDDLT
jgi:hypothetical protein